MTENANAVFSLDLQNPNAVAECDSAVAARMAV